MSDLRIFTYPYSQDNYGFLVHAPTTGETAALDCGEAAPLLAALAEQGRSLTHLLITHHHGDHTAGLAEVKAQTGCAVYGPKERSQAIAGLDHHLDGGDSLSFGGREVQILHTPGHTLDMINYHFAEDKALFSGDTLFALGCGRVFEGTPEMMHKSLALLADLPPDTAIYFCHEYTLANARFALSIDKTNTALAERAAQIEEMRAKGEATVPSSLAEELATNPFLRASDPAIRKTLGLEDASDAEVFADIRRRKDEF